MACRRSECVEGQARLTPAEASLLAYLKTHPRATARDMRRDLMLSWNECQNMLAALKAKKLTLCRIRAVPGLGHYLEIYDDEKPIYRRAS